ncbi:Alpha/Beta hydrolase protein [Podospora australis]|uniref:Alpha/Beta hydrolase protein n=1 Tax=Podospora australis TaxID=1536484 RepID=A0AAN6WT58_9PEZI|nr:Alpha/Beta hydrolase protein [Podospora australis]
MPPPNPNNPTILTHQPSVGFFQNIWLCLCAFAYRHLCEFIFWRFKFADRKFWAAQTPDKITSYPSRPSLSHHVFIPKSHQPGQKHALYLLVHGVAFIVGTPSTDHAQARFLADRHDYVVVVLSYRRAPEHRFPTAIYDVAAVIESVLSDSSLPIDTDKVVLGGFSSGASIVLAVAQLPSVQQKLKAIVSFYPLTDRSGQVRGGYRSVMPWGLPDDMEKTKTLSDWGLPAPGQDLRDKLISPYFVSGRKDIPQPVCIVTAGADMLCKEGYAMACKLAGREDASKANDEKEREVSWEQNGVKYVCAKDMPHGFTHFWVVLQKEWRDTQLKRQDEAWGEVTGWLDRVLYSPKK